MIFNNNSNGAEEAKALLGFIYASNSFENLVTYIKIAERDIKRVIDPAVFKLAEDHYHSENYKKQDATAMQKLLDQLVEHIQLPVLLYAYRRYAPLSDLSHSESGRQITVTTELKPAFEWMLERDNRSLLDIAHETTDILIEFLDEQVKINDTTPNTIEDTWRGSSTFALQKNLFINSAREFDSIFPINASRRLYLVLVPFIREVEQRFIRPAIGVSRYDTIKELIKDGDLDKPENAVNKEIYDLAKISIALLTISIALKRLSVELLPDSVVQSFSTIAERQTKSAVQFDRVGVSAFLERDGKREIIPLQNYITSLLPVAEVIEDETDTTQPFAMM